MARNTNNSNTTATDKTTDTERLDKLEQMLEILVAERQTPAPEPAIELSPTPKEMADLIAQAVASALPDPKPEPKAVQKPNPAELHAQILTGAIRDEKAPEALKLIKDEDLDKASQLIRAERIREMTWLQYAKFLAGENWQAVLVGALAAIALRYLGQLAYDWYNGTIGADAASEIAGDPELAMVG